VSLPAAILGFLQLEPATGYTLKSRFESSVASFWTVTQSQIYRELHGLEREGLVVVRRQPGQGKPNRKVYALSAAGQSVLAAWLRQPLEPLQVRHPLLLKFVFSGEVAPAELDAQLQQYAGTLTETREAYAARLIGRQIVELARSKREIQIWRLSVVHGLHWCDAELAWVNLARRTLGTGKTSAGTPRRKAKRAPVATPTKRARARR
jgi:PadR family transcriptional regulator, regulatory protein AphA